MFPQQHNTILDQMLHQQFSPSPLPIPGPMDRSSNNNSRSWKPNIEIAPNCPRCASTNTKFCYYNNYSLSQPRYFCKGCRRYWTKGGSLRNVPVGGGCRKNRRAKSKQTSQTERVNSVNNFHEETESSIDGDGSRPSNGPRDIDMALVFANFLNQKPNSTTTGEEFENGTSSSSNNVSNSLETESDAVIQPQKNDSGQIEETRVQNFEGDELNLSGIDELEGLFVDEDVLWSDAAISSSSVTWQPSTMQMQLQELEFSMPLNEEDQLLPISSNSTVNLISDSWSSFDLSAMEIFSSRP